jgi:ketosteroid isomerase-like protein
VDDVVVEYIHTVPGYPRRIVGRPALVELYRPYSETMMLHRSFDLVKYHDREAGVVVLEYASEGHAVSTGAPYLNHFISAITVTDRKIIHWRDYLDPIASVRCARMAIRLLTPSLWFGARSRAHRPRCANPRSSIPQPNARQLPVGHNEIAVMAPARGTGQENAYADEPSAP